MARGGLSKLIGQGVGLAAEYNHHRRQQAENRAQHVNESDDVEVNDPSTNQQVPAELPADLPPAYAESARESETSLGGDGPHARSADDKRSPSPLRDHSDAGSDSSSLLSLEDDEGDWELDDLEREEAITPPESVSASTASLPSYEESEATKHREQVDDLVRQVISQSRARDSEPQASKSYQALPYPVILPQRRPRKKSRGFIRAYAPILAQCGIDQKTFLSFLKSFHKASQASPIFPVIQISAAIAGFAPGVIAMAICTTAQISARVGEEVQARVRTNDFLDRMNEELFKPHGLYAMIVKYKSEAEMEQGESGPVGRLSKLVKAEKVDLSTTQSIAKYMKSSSEESSASGMQNINERLHGLRLASNTTHGKIELPEAAPLIFPDLDSKLEHDGPETFKDRTTDAKQFLANYLDRRAQMQYAMQNPNSGLVVPEDQRSFGSKLADPSHPMHSGGLIALLTGGKANPRQAKSDRRAERHEQRRERRMERDVRRAELGQSLRSKREGKRARRFGDDYLDELAARTGRHGRRGESGLLGSMRARGQDSHSTVSVNSNASQSQLSQGAASSHGSSRHERKRAGRRGGGGAVKRLMSEDVLYLMIVNLPSEAELEEARQELERSK